MSTDAPPTVISPGPLRAEFLAGVREMLPLLVALTPLALLVGGTVSAAADPWAAWMGSLPIYGGSAQLAVLGSLADGGGLIVAVVAGVLINLRVAVYSAALGPLWSGSRWWTRAAAAAAVIDPTWMVAEGRASRGGTLSERRAHYAGAALMLTCGWLLLVSAGAVGVGLVGGAATVLGIALPLCLLELVVPRLAERPGLAAVAAAVIVAVAARGLPSGVSLLLAMLAAAVAGVVVEHSVWKGGAR